MHAAGVHVPQVIARDLDRGFLLLSDLGTTTYLKALNEHNADALFSDATDALIDWQLSSSAAVLPPYDEALLRRELELFPRVVHGAAPRRLTDGEQRQLLDDVFFTAHHCQSCAAEGIRASAITCRET